MIEKEGWERKDGEERMEREGCREERWRKGKDGEREKGWRRGG